MHKCLKCDKSFKSELALRGHQRVHSNNYKEVQAKHTKRLVEASNNKREKAKDEYYKNPIYCLNCNKIISYEKTIASVEERKYCDHSCAATHTNKSRPPKSKETRDKLAKSLSEYHKNNPMSVAQRLKISKSVSQRRAKEYKNTNMIVLARTKVTKSIFNPFSRAYFRNSVVGDYSTLFNNTCKHCNTRFVNRKNVRYCQNHSDLYKNNNRNRYAFTFSLRTYPDIFGHMSEQLKEVGMWGYDNTNGLTRDHKLSVNEAIKNNYDPYYIKHPLNCELMSWTENNKKKTKSSITYEKLKQLVDDYDTN